VAQGLGENEGSGLESGQIACSISSVLLRQVRAAHGEQAVAKVLAMAGVEHTPDYLDDVGNWIWYDQAVALLEAAAELTGDPRIGLRVGEEMVRQHAGTPVATLMRSLGSPEAIYEQLTIAVGKFSTVTEVRALEVSPGQAVVHAKARPGFTRDVHLCDWARGMLSQPPVLFGLPPAKVEETRCELRGDDHCLYTVTWDAEGAAKASDPHQLVTALEAQLAAMTGRLESMYATARDLIASDDLDAALARITERAATAVRAPRYLLAVRTGAERRLHVHHRGYRDDEASAAAHALLERTGEGRDESRLVAEVASASRHYGRLMAVSPGVSFFPHERDLLDVYARYAAAVLDTATALDDARRRHDQARALLELAQNVAVAGTREEVAQRLVDAVPVVVDCDRVAVFLWNETDDALTCHAVTELTGDRDDVVRDLQVRLTDTPLLARLVDDPAPQPLFVEPHTEDRFVADILERTESQALVVVPIAANGRFHGILNVSVVERAERLDPCSALLDLLAGVVAQASTALDNARLLETMSHQARHDNLTGLLGHRAFQEALDERLRVDGPDPTFTLATIDIDDFKLVNDAHGHPAGDEALCHVADALRRSVRDQDTVFRVGGEEFAVLLPGLVARDALPVAERLRAAVAGAPFSPALRVSIGLASWPQDAPDRDALLRRADAALYAAKRAGKDQTALAA
jgi:diguanylate cyclase (GGDEF)-like protein